MDKPTDVVFNNQAVDGPAPLPKTTQTDPAGQQPLQYNQGPHAALLEAITKDNYDKAVEILNSVPHPDQLLNLTEATYKQSAIYKATMMTNLESSLAFTRLFIAKGAVVLGKDVHGQSPLFYICKDGRVDLLNLYLENKADINETDNFRQTPLFYASRDGKDDIVRLMIANQVNVNHKDRAEQTALFYASRDNRLEAVRALIEGGANVNMADGKKQTALFFARKNGHEDIVEFLISNGAINTKDGILRQSDLRKTIKQSELTSA